MVPSMCQLFGVWTDEAMCYLLHRVRCCVSSFAMCSVSSWRSHLCWLRFLLNLDPTADPSGIRCFSAQIKMDSLWLKLYRIHGNITTNAMLILCVIYTWIMLMCLLCLSCLQSNVNVISAIRWILTNNYKIFCCPFTLQNCLAKALYDNHAESPEELEFQKGDMLTVLEQNPNGLQGNIDICVHLCKLYQVYIDDNTDTCYRERVTSSGLYSCHVA